MPSGPTSVIGIHVLPDECYLAHAGIGQPLDFGDDLFNWPRDFGSTCVGHYAKRAELVATFLYGDKSGNAALGDHVSFGCSQNVELVLDWKLGIDDFLAALSARDHGRQTVIILRADDQIDRAGAADDFFAFRLCDATGDYNHHAAAVPCRSLFHLADAADLRIDLLRSFFADVTGVQNDEIGVLGTSGLGEPGGNQGVRHTMGIVDVHLATEGFDVDFAGSAHAGSVRSASNLACRGRICPARPYI